MPQAIRISIVCLLWLSWGAAAAQNAPAAAAAARSTGNEFLRIARSNDGAPLAFQTSIVHLASDSASSPEVTVDLVAAVHIGDARYYEELNTRFRDYDSVLYELVAPQGTRVPLGGGPRRSFLSGVQSGMTDVLGLAFQLEEIDYTQPNFVHSDLSPDEMARSMAEHGESAADYLLKAMGVSLNEQARDPFGLQGFAMLAALLSPDRERLLKIQLAGSMLSLDQVTAVIEGKEGSSLIGERNKRAVTVLEDRIRRGDKHIAIFYGAAHMTDMAKRIDAAVGLRPVGSEWLDAWDLR